FSPSPQSGVEKRKHRSIAKELIYRTISLTTWALQEPCSDNMHKRPPAQPEHFALYSFLQKVS
ncbi:MAG: hypothetical protein JW720_12885, partial [Sedimentisphaerales bacterium]|nr:hypothetical protein [Sedimentisphaerales bacterium]